MQKISEKIRQVVMASGQTGYAISQATGIEESVISRWLRKKRGVSVGTLDRLAEHFGLELKPRRSKHAHRDK